MAREARACKHALALVRFAQQTTELFAKQDCFGETRALPYDPGSRGNLA